MPKLYNGYPGVDGNKPDTWQGWLKRMFVVSQQGRVTNWWGTDGRTYHMAHVADDGRIQSTIQSYVDQVPPVSPPTSVVEKDLDTGFCYLRPYSIGGNNRRTLEPIVQH